MLRTRLLLHLLPFVVILLATGIYAIVLFSRLAASVDTSVGGNYRRVLTAQQMLLSLAELNHQAWANAETRAPNPKAFAAEQKRFEEKLSLLLQNAPLPEQAALCQQLTHSYEAFQKALATFNTLVDPNARQRLYNQTLRPQSLKLQTVLDNIVELNQQALLATSQRIENLTRGVIRLMMVGIAVALLLSVYGFYQLSRSVLRPIQTVTHATRELGEGNLSHRVPVVSRDELGELAIAFNKMAAQLQEYRQSTTEELLRLHRTMETTLASFPDPIFVLDRQGRIELRNPAASDFTSSLQLNGELPPRLAAIARDTLATGQHFLPNSFKEVFSCRVNQAEKYFLPRVLTMRSKEDTLYGVAVVLYDVTRFRLLDAAKSNLVATVSHELKTPLTSVRLVLHILLEKTVGELTSKQDELLQAARDDTERLLRILNDLLDLARLEEGNSELHREPVAPADLLRDAVENLADKASAKALKLSLQLDSSLPPVLVDRQRVGHVFTNLLTNAINHSPAGGEILLRATRAGAETIQFSVTDHGPGIPPEFHTRILERFFRVPGQVKPGAGLGLSIAREIAVAHGGRLWVQSTPGHGATFYLLLQTGEQPRTES